MFSSRDDNRGSSHHSKHDHSDRLRSQDDDSHRYGSGSDSYSTGSSYNTPPGKTTYDTYSSSYGSGRNDNDRDTYGSGRNDNDRDTYGSGRNADNDYSTSDSYGRGRADYDSNVTGNSYDSTTKPRGYSPGSRNDSNLASGTYGTRTTHRSDDDYSGSSSYGNRRDDQDTYGSRSSNKNDDNEDKSFMSSMVDKAKDMVGKGPHSHDQGHRDLRDDDYDNDRNKHKHKGHNKHDNKTENKSFTAALFGE